MPLEPIRREHRTSREQPVDNGAGGGGAESKSNAKQLEFASFSKKSGGESEHGAQIRESKVLKLKEMKQLLDNDYKV